ncbi:hypothetical protein OBV_15780 [Oscillibacter valericigenes Sjm18-20]|nr:hypothetical protein OBV_15780 [Oscillibacter valericigenes Sjm18-20]
MNRKLMSLFLVGVLTVLPLAGCGKAASGGDGQASGALAFDNTAWNYNAEDDGVYRQAGVQYCESPVSTDYKTLGIYVPAAYMISVDNDDGTYTCELSSDGAVNGYTAATAPVVMPIDTEDYTAQSAPTDYATGLTDYLNAGFICVIAGCRGRTAPLPRAPTNGETPPDGVGPGAGGTPPSGEAPTDGAASPDGEGGPQSGAPDSTSGTVASVSIAASAVPLAAEGSSSATESTAPSSTADNDGTDDSVTGSAPWDVTDLKAAVRYLRYNAAVLPGDEERIFTFGTGGGAQSVLMGVTGDCELYTPYLEGIGAAMTDANGNSLSDAVFGSMSWCPITSLDYADEAYEWSTGQYENSGTRADGLFTSTLSDDLAASYVEYINTLGLTGEDGTALTLEQSEDGIYTAGTYYDYLMGVIETSLNNFLADTQFPYTPDNNTKAVFAGGDNGMPQKNTEISIYATAEDYIAALNTDVVWITYDAAIPLLPAWRIL